MKTSNPTRLLLGEAHYLKEKKSVMKLPQKRTFKAPKINEVYLVSKKFQSRDPRRIRFRRSFEKLSFFIEAYNA